MILNSISSLIVVLTPEAAEKIIIEFCQQLSSENFKGIGWNSNVSCPVHLLIPLLLTKDFRNMCIPTQFFFFCL